MAYIYKQPEIKKVTVRKKDERVAALITNLLQNEISLSGLEELRGKVTAEDLSDIIQHIYDLNEKYILEISAVDGVLRKLDDIKNTKRNKYFNKKIKAGFRNLKDQNKKVILAEGDSWFNYPIILTDIIDRIAMEKDFAVYSLASGGDWLLNMLTGRHYVEQLSVLHPDVFLISGGGNDLVGSGRLAAVVDPLGCKEYEKNSWAINLVNNSNKKVVPFHKEQFENGKRFLSKDFFALLMFFHLEYHYLIGNILEHAKDPGDKFYGIHIVTQGYDYPIPSTDKNFGWNPFLWYVPFIRTFLGHGGWQKVPLMARGINNSNDQKDLVYAMIYLFNEMMIETGKNFNEIDCCHVSHIDSRGSIGVDGWTDELHAKPSHFIKIAETFIGCIKKTISPNYNNVFVVNPQKNKV